MHTKSSLAARGDESITAAPEQSPAWSRDEHTLVDVVRHWARIQPSRQAYLYVADGNEQALSFHELDRRASAIARALRASGREGTTALLLYRLGLEFVEAFFGCLYAGVIAVPLHPGRGKRADELLNRMALDCGARALLTTSALASSYADMLRDDRSRCSVELIETDRVCAVAARDGNEAQSSNTARPEQVAFLQYTSGSTSQPKGTVVTHRNIMANQAMLQSVFGTQRSTVIASWLPIFHDMGLIGNVLHAAYLGVPAVLISTLGFIKSPISWLRAIERYQASFSGAPNFAYDLCVAKTTPAEREGLDLSRWRVAFNGAEPVRERTLEAFCRTFAPHGFCRNAFVPTYGLAEATLVVSGSGGSEPTYFHADERLLEQHVVARAHSPAAERVLVSTGRCDHGDQSVVIVSPSSLQPCSPTEVGEIWIAGSHVAAGYWNQESATQQAFHAQLAGDERRYLRTGDLGFIINSQLFITGRQKDLIIFRGQNLYPQDIELTVELTCPELRPGCTAAFALEGSADVGLVVVAELERREAYSAGMLQRIVRAVQENHEVPLQRLVLVRRNTVPKTTSGKLQRKTCLQELLLGGYDCIAEWRSPAVSGSRDLADSIAAHAVAWIARHIAQPPASVERSAALASFGLDSIRKVELVRWLEQRFGIVVSDEGFFALESIDDLVRLVVDLAPALEPRLEPGPPSERGAAVLPDFSAMTWRDES
jgi:acyl-CoA synthetase (AMP-forming)/AMP-acid ligase II/acyl carrier protein